MKNAIQLSVIVPTIGRPEYFSATLQSLLNQTTRDFELLVSDNFADPPVEITQDGRIQHLRLEQRLSFSTHFNFCIESAQGNWCVFVSDDDLVAPNFVELILEAIRLFPTASLIFPLQERMDAQDFATPPSPQPLFDERESFRFIDSVMKGKQPNFMTAVSMVGKRKDILEVGGFPDYPKGLHADNCLWTKLAKRGSSVILPVCMRYRVYSDSVGLSASHKELLDATYSFETHLRTDVLDTSDSKESALYKTWVDANSGCLVSRWRQSRNRSESVINDAVIVFRMLVRFLRKGDIKNIRLMLMSFPGYLRTRLKRLKLRLFGAHEQRLS